MTAQQQHSTSQLFHTSPHTTDSTMLQWVKDEMRKESKKRRRSIDHKDFNIPPQKSPRKNDDQIEQLIDTLKPNQNDMLLAYKRIWDNLDLNLPADASLEPFVWRKIRELQQK